MTASTWTNRRWWARALAIGVATLAVVLWAAGPMTPGALAQAGGDQGKAKGKPDAKPDAKEAPAETLDEVIFKNGNKVQGKILEETATSIRMKVTVAGISTEATYVKADILQINKDAVKVAPKKSDADKGAGKSDAPAKGKDDEGQIVDKDGKAIPAENLKVYAVVLKGEFGRNFSFPTIDRLLDDMKRLQPDAVVLQFAFDFAYHGREKMDFGGAGGTDAFNQLEQAREMWTSIKSRVQTDFKKPPRMVAWIKKAMGGAAFLPCAFEEIYFTSDGLHGGLGGLDELFKGVGDEVAQEKQRSLRLSRAKGLVEEGKHDTRIMEAMTRLDFWLSYKIEGGQVIFRTEKPNTPDWILLKDDGSEGYADSAQDVLRMQGNDYLTMNAKVAQTIGWSKGTADNLDELLFKMGVDRNFSVLKTRAERIMKTWAEEVKGAEDNVLQLTDKYRRVQVRAPGGYRERTAARGQRITLLKEILGILDRYKNEINPARIRLDPESTASDIRVIINRLENEQRADRP